MQDDPPQRKHSKGDAAVRTPRKSSSISIGALFAKASARQKKIVAASKSRCNAATNATTICSDSATVETVSICDETDVVVVDLSLSQDDSLNDSQSLPATGVSGDSGRGGKKSRAPSKSEADAVGKSQPGSSSSNHSGKWACRACTFLNTDLANTKARWRRRRCQVCGAPRDDTEGSSSACSPPPAAETNFGEPSPMNRTQQCTTSSPEQTFEADDPARSAAPIYVQWGSVMQSRRAKTYADLGHRVSYQRTISATMAKNPKSAAGKFVAFFVKNPKQARSDSGLCGGSSAHGISTRGANQQQQRNLAALADGLLLRRIVQSWMLEQTPRPFVRSNYRSVLGERYQPGCGTGKHDHLRQSSSSRWFLPPQPAVTTLLPSSAQDSSAAPPPSPPPPQPPRARSRLEMMESNMRFILSAVSCSPKCDMFEAGSADARAFGKICDIFGVVSSRQQQDRGGVHTKQSRVQPVTEHVHDSFVRLLVVVLFYTHGKSWNRLSRLLHNWLPLQSAARHLVNAPQAGGGQASATDALSLNLLSGEIAKILHASRSDEAQGGVSLVSLVSFSSAATPGTGSGREKFGLLSVSDAIAASDAVEFPVHRTDASRQLDKSSGSSSSSRGINKLRRFWLVLDVLHNHVDAKLVAQWVKQHCRTPRLKKPKPATPSSAHAAGSNQSSARGKSVPSSVGRTGSFSGRMSTKTACAVDFIEAMLREAEAAQTSLPPETSNCGRRKRTMRSPTKLQLMTGPSETFQKFLESCGSPALFVSLDEVVSRVLEAVHCTFFAAGPGWNPDIAAGVLAHDCLNRIPFVRDVGQTNVLLQCRFRTTAKQVAAVRRAVELSHILEAAACVGDAQTAHFVASSALDALELLCAERRSTDGNGAATIASSSVQTRKKNATTSTPKVSTTLESIVASGKPVDDIGPLVSELSRSLHENFYCDATCNSPSPVVLSSVTLLSETVLRSVSLLEKERRYDEATRRLARFLLVCARDTWPDALERLVIDLQKKLPVAPGAAVSQSPAAVTPVAPGQVKRKLSSTKAKASSPRTHSKGVIALQVSEAALRALNSTLAREELPGGPIRITIHRHFARLQKSLAPALVSLLEPPYRVAPEWTLVAVRRCLDDSDTQGSPSNSTPRSGGSWSGRQRKKRLWDISSTVDSRSAQRNQNNQQWQQGKTTSSVEECVRTLYLTELNGQGNGPWRGAHAENSLLLTLFHILFCDIILQPTPTADLVQSESTAFTGLQDSNAILQYGSLLQAFPELVERRLAEIAAPMTDNDHGGHEVLRRMYNRYHGQQVCGVDWDTWSLSDLEQVFCSFGASVASNLCRLYCQNYFWRRGGIADLFFWKARDYQRGRPFDPARSVLEFEIPSETKPKKKRTKSRQQAKKAKAKTGPDHDGQIEVVDSPVGKKKHDVPVLVKPAVSPLGPAVSGKVDAMFVEVKGPGDSLSDKQRMWCHNLNSLGCHAHVCYVRAVAPSHFVRAKEAEPQSQLVQDIVSLE